MASTHEIMKLLGRLSQDDVTDEDVKWFCTNVLNIIHRRINIFEVWLKLKRFEADRIKEVVTMDLQLNEKAKKMCSVIYVPPNIDTITPIKIFIASVRELGFVGDTTRREAYEAITNFGGQHLPADIIFPLLNCHDREILIFEGVIELFMSPFHFLNKDDSIYESVTIPTFEMTRKYIFTLERQKVHDLIRITTAHGTHMDLEAYLPPYYRFIFSG